MSEEWYWRYVQASDEAERLGAEVAKLRADLHNMTLHARDAGDRSDRAVAERDELADKVRALADKADSRGSTAFSGARIGDIASAWELRALLDGGERA